MGTRRRVRRLSGPGSGRLPRLERLRASTYNAGHDAHVDRSLLVSGRHQEKPLCRLRRTGFYGGRSDAILRRAQRPRGHPQLLGLPHRTGIPLQ
ncbi:hypothetical protein G6F62_014946 [Rhizopus arrhizus]|nr:hypothetical protein G6F32_014319 [Rhizopus arrhizus]KAG1308826.1 hypothetical protein G6F62_014946 [Rhizopus arrhizus]